MEFNERSSSYYSILGIDEYSSDEEIRRAYRKLAMQWHPDKWTRTPSLLGEAKKKFQQIQEAYSVLSDQKKRMMYDAGLYNPDEHEDEGFADFLQEMATLMSDTRKEDKYYSMEDLQNMLWEMAESFDNSTCNWSSFSQQQNYELPQFFCSPFAYDDSTLRTGQMDSNFTGRNPFLDFSNMEMHRFCRSTT